MKVNYPIEVPEKIYCWDGHRACSHFDNYREDKCRLSIGYLSRDDKGRTLKPKECLALKPVK